MKNFEVKTKITFGKNSLARLKSLETDRVFIVSDPFVVSSKLIEYIENPLSSAGVKYTLFTDVVPDPPIDKVIKGVHSLLSGKEEYIIAVGGGSALDTAKAIRKFATSIDGSYRPKLICIPTTSGTGSEVTSFAVISDGDKGKYPLSSEDMLPEEAILDEVLVKSVPPSVTADTGMDVMTHAIEAYVSINNNEFSGALAEKAVEICGQFLLRSYADCNDSHARRKVHIASCLAGLAFNSASLGLNHGMAHQLGARFHIPHGRANAILLPYIIEYNSDIRSSTKSQKEYRSCVRKYCNVARILGVSNLNEVTTIRAIVSYLQFMMQEMNMPLKVSQIIGIDEKEYFDSIEQMAESALKDACTATNPRVPTKEEVIEIYKKIW